MALVPRTSSTPHLSTRHGELALPVFLPDATRGVVRSVDAADLASAGVRGVCVSALHLASNPGAGAVRAAGGIHKLMGWDSPVLSDSGGFQIYSLLAESPRSGSVTAKGFRYRLDPSGGKKLLTAAKSIQVQRRLGSDICVCLDHCTHPAAPPDEQAASVANTLAWAKACREEFDRSAAADGTKLFAVVQGGADAEGRRRCAEGLLAIGFDGYGFGGWPLDDAGRLIDAVAQVAELLPADAPKWALGVGKPENVAAAAAMGYGLFDCALPTRDARRGRLYASAGDDYERLHITDARYVRDGAPVDPECDCLCCRRYSRAYLHHLFHIRDSLAGRLATIHNLRFYTRWTTRLRTEGL